VNVAIVAGLMAAVLVIHDPIVACAQEGSPEQAAKTFTWGVHLGWALGWSALLTVEARGGRRATFTY
jgi:hypothetical protein